ncbi:MAG: 3-deoxy-7-phosphoheptulonate synthase [Chitinivibrionales bacterium]|nr:3-deoxy-7-phosphoheptulonate synthase [Chitinivibrionales bacterium]
MERLENINIESFSTLPSPRRIRRDIPLTDKAAQKAAEGRHAIERILRRESDRFIIVSGPCSVHNVDAALEYARRLKELSDQVGDRILLVMRAYVEKPRTTLGWKGLIYDPDLDGSCDIERGLHVSRKLLSDIAEMGLPVGCEVLDPVMPQYLADLVSWAVIGARTTESQTHRQLVSGLSMPTGFKNPTDGSIKVAVEAIQTAAAHHSFLGVTDEGRSGLFRTRGNPFCHLVLRGGTLGPNHGAEHVAFARVLMQKVGVAPNIVVDCSHANSGKRAERQGAVLDDIVEQVVGGETALVGAMLESNLKPGRQDMACAHDIEPDQSITDACIGWESTRELVLSAYERLGARSS